MKNNRLQPDVLPADCRTQRHLDWLKQWSTATQVIIMGIIIQSLLQSLADVFIPENSIYKIVFWLVVLAGTFILFVFLESILTYASDGFGSLVDYAAQQRRAADPVDTRASFPITSLTYSAQARGRL